MRWILPAATALVVAGLVLGIWLVFGSPGAPEGPSSGPGETRPETDAPSRSRSEGGAEREPFDWAKTVAGWNPGVGLPAPPVAPLRGLPPAVADLSGLTFGLDSVASNNFEVKGKVLEIVQELRRMDEQEKARLAEYFRSCDQPGTKYWLLVAFRMTAGDPFVEPVAEYYDAEPALVGETLQYMIPRSERAAEELEKIIERTLDPREREALLARLAFVGSERAQPALVRAFERGPGTTDRRAAVSGLARLRTPESRELLRRVVSGPYEEAYYDPAAPEPATESMRDLRAHAVVGLLMGGEPEQVGELLDRLEVSGTTDPVASYVEEFFAVTRRPEFVGRVCDLMIRRREIAAPFLHYIAAQARPEDLPAVERLLSMDLSPEDGASVAGIIGALR